MKVYRGPKSKSFYDVSHEHVATVSPAELAKVVKDKSNIQFNISKDGLQREAVCTVHFEDQDLILMLQGFLDRLEMQRKTLLEILKNANLDDKGKLSSIEKTLKTL